MSMLNFYINRAGKNLTSKKKQPLEKAKIELRKLFHRKEKEWIWQYSMWQENWALCNKFYFYDTKRRRADEFVAE